MDWQSVKEKVTEQVIKQLQADGIAATPDKVQQLVTAALAAKSPAPAQAAAPVAVLERPAAPVAPAPVAAVAPAPAAPARALPACDVPADFKTDILAVVAGPVCDKVVGALKELAAERKVTVVATGGSERLAALEACGQVLCEGSESIARRLVKGAGAVIAPVVSTSSAAKVGSLIGDCLGTAVLVEAALAGKKVVVARESIAAPADAGWAIRRKVEEIVNNLRGLGFVVADLSGFVAEVKKVAGAAPAAGTGFAPAYVRPAAAAPAPAAAPALANGDYDRELARMIDHTLLKPEATAEQVTKLCKEALEYKFFSVCVNPQWVPLAARLLKGSEVAVCTVIGFPLGANSPTIKALETAETIAHGATEVDMVLNVGAMKSGEYERVFEDMQAVANAAKGKALTKVILETALLTDEEKVKACELAVKAGLDYVKTSTGFGPGGATAADIALMRKTVGPKIGVKASGGIRDYETTMAMVKAGASRIGASASVNIVKRVAAKPAGKGQY